jgi:hypothetical protein
MSRYNKKPAFVLYAEIILNILCPNVKFDRETYDYFAKNIKFSRIMYKETANITVAPKAKRKINKIKKKSNEIDLTTSKITTKIAVKKEIQLYIETYEIPMMNHEDSYQKGLMLLLPSQPMGPVYYYDKKIPQFAIKYGTKTFFFPISNKFPYHTLQTHLHYLAGVCHKEEISLEDKVSDVLGTNVKAIIDIIGEERVIKMLEDIHQDKVEEILKENKNFVIKKKNSKIQEFD